MPGQLARLGVDGVQSVSQTDFGAYDLERETWHGDLLTSLLD
jgi:hypothetical protein